ncbi:MAG TPA: hypothetical protein EYM84_02305 [Flavobacteriales bacterium]|nr:hypothetical protein [Flavobacteriales bacterium]
MKFDGTFFWFTGIIEDRRDPLGIGRVRVRCFGIDNESRKEQPTQDLPWAYPMLPFNNDQVVHPPKEGTWVVGFFRDGKEAQDRIVMGTINTGAFDISSSTEMT